MFKTGGLEPNQAASKVLKIDNVNYVVSDKFRMMLRDSFIDWGTFLEVYHDNLDYTTMFDQMIKLLNVKENENLREFMLPMVKKIYHLPAESHMSCMMKQYMIYEPVSVAIQSLFTTIKLHYEFIVKKFILARNKYILEKNTKDKTNDLEALRKYWADMNDQYNLDTSSLVLLFINPPNGLKSKLNINISKFPDVIEKLRIAIKKFHYGGFCPKVPHKRLKMLLEFPVNEFVLAIKQIDPDAKFPDYSEVEKLISAELASMPEKPSVPDTYERKKPPSLKDNLEVAKWYIDEILELRKHLLPFGTKYEDYYTEQAKVLIKINDIILEKFRSVE